jgi:SAM-dependent methyltransferase
LRRVINFIRSFGLGSKKPNSRDYRWAWVDPDGANYRLSFYERQRKGGAKPLVDNPTVAEVVKILDQFETTTVLEVGCGFGRLLEQLPPRFKAAGCDISQDMLSKAPANLSTFHLDIAYPPANFIVNEINRWDCIFTRGVMLYLIENEEACMNAIKNMRLLAKKKVIFWEWPEVCDSLRALCGNDNFFNYQPILHKDE